MGIDVTSLKSLKKVAKAISECMQPGDCFLLYGGMGAGKTTFVSYVMDALSVQNVTSPTFSIINQYTYHTPIYHFDLYRITTPQAVLGLDLDRYFMNQDAIFFIEWPEHLFDFLPEKAIKTIFEMTNDGYRYLSFPPTFEKKVVLAMK